MVDGTASVSFLCKVCAECEVSADAAGLHKVLV